MTGTSLFEGSDSLWRLDQARIDPPEPKPEYDDGRCEDCPGGRMCCCAHDDREDQ